MYILGINNQFLGDWPNARHMPAGHSITAPMIDICKVSLYIYALVQSLDLVMTMTDNKRPVDTAIY